MINCPKCHCAAYCGRKCMDADAAEHAKSCFLLAQCLSHYRYSVVQKKFLPV